MKKTFSIIAAMLIMGTTAWAKADIQVVLSPDYVVFGRQFEVSYIVDGNGQEISLKNTDKFDIVSGPYRYARNYTAREKDRLVTRTRTSYTYIMIPRESGEINLPKAKIKLTRGSATSKTTKIIVQEPSNFWSMDFPDFDSFFDEPTPPACRQHGQKRHDKKCDKHQGGKHGDKHNDHGNCHHHEMHISTFSPDQVDTTGCEVTTCAPDSAKQGDTFCLSYSIGAQADSIALSDTTNFEILGGPGYGTSWQSIWENGKQQNRFEQRYTYMVRARKAGELTLPKAKIWIGDTQKQSSEKTISIQANEAK